jgi:sterol desaturase/sphingolipid hydroxylase (fatty acid hydroxylase superfamily)
MGTRESAECGLRPASPLPKKLTRFAIVNVLVTAVAACAWCFGQVRTDFVGLWLGAVVRCALSIAMISALTRGGEPIGSRRAGLRWRERVLIWMKIVLYFAPADALVLSFAKTLASADQMDMESQQWPSEPAACALAFAVRYARFVALSFVWELVFDFCHYWVHRACHASTTLYQMVHKTHHQHRSPSPLTTYDHSPLDVLGSNALPAMFGFATLAALGAPICGEAEQQMLYAFKAYVEVAGHSGVNTRPRSFPQFCWLPGAIPCTRTPDGYAGIAGHTREHDWHHAVLRCNFSKRFRVWDVAFGTYEWPERDYKSERR